MCFHLSLFICRIVYPSYDYAELFLKSTMPTDSNKIKIPFISITKAWIDNKESKTNRKSSFRAYSLIYGYAWSSKIILLLCFIFFHRCKNLTKKLFKFATSNLNTSGLIRHHRLHQETYSDLYFSSFSCYGGLSRSNSSGKGQYNRKLFL